MRRNYLIYLILFIFIFSSTVVGFNLKINNQNIDFDITPNNLEDNSYIPIDQLKNMGNFYFGELSSDGYLIMYKNNFYMFSLSNNVVKSNEGNIQLEYKPLKLNDHVLVPFELIKIIFQEQIEMKQENNNQNLELMINLKEGKINKNEKLVLDINILNQTKEKITLEFSSGQKYNIIIKNTKGNIVYNWAENQMFIQAFVSEEIKANSSLEFKEELNLSRLESGEYILEVRIVAENYKITSETKKIVIK